MRGIHFFLIFILVDCICGGIVYSYTLKKAADNELKDRKEGNYE